MNQMDKHTEKNKPKQTITLITPPRNLVINLIAITLIRIDLIRTMLFSHNSIASSKLT